MKYQVTLSIYHPENDEEITSNAVELIRHFAGQFYDIVNDFTIFEASTSETAESCHVCLGRRYLISHRSADNLRAIERCDGCADGILDDTDAAKLARLDGITCADTYPCYLEEDE